MTDNHSHPMRREGAFGCGDDVRAACDSLEQVEKRMEDRMQSELKLGKERMDSIEAKIDANSKDTAEVLDIMRMGKSFFKVIGHIGSFIKWVAAIGAPVVAFYLALKAGGKQ